MNKTVIISLVTIFTLCSSSQVTIAGDRYRYSRPRHTPQVHSTVSPSCRNVDTAYEELARYGTWHDTLHFGLAWHPTVAMSTRSWHPYRNGGSWTFPYGSRQWMSHYSWGHIVFSTTDGSWRNIAGGWHWVPERDWRGFYQAIEKVPLRKIRHQPDQFALLHNAIRTVYQKATYASDHDVDRYPRIRTPHSSQGLKSSRGEVKPSRYNPFSSKHLSGRGKEPPHPKLPPQPKRDYKDHP